MFKHQIRVAYGNVTVGDHVYYARYLDFLEAARNEFFRALGCPFIQLQKEGVVFPVVEASLRFHSAARYDDLIDIEVHVVELGKAQFRLDYRVLCGEVLLLTASTRHAVTDLAGKPVRMPGALHTALQPHLCS